MVDHSLTNINQNVDCLHNYVQNENVPIYEGVLILWHHTNKIGTYFDINEGIHSTA